MMNIGLTALLFMSTSLCVGVAQFMPGLSPATPNNALDVCQTRAVSRPMNFTHQGSHGEILSRWCSTYDSVLPCLSNVLSTSTDNANDWFLSLVYDQSMASRMSRSMCSRFPYISNLSCVNSNMANVSTCMQWNTRTAIQNFRTMYNPNGTRSQETNAVAAIYACIISVQTAGCFHRELTACSESKRKLVYDYYIMLSGKCKEIASIEPPSTEATPTRSSQSDPSTRPLLVGGANPPRGLPNSGETRDTADQSNSRNTDTRRRDRMRHMTNADTTTPENAAQCILIDHRVIVILATTILILLNIW